MYKKYLLTATASLCFLTPGLVYAGQACEQKSPSVTMVTQGLALAVKTAAQLNASGAEVVIIGRVGQDLSKYGQHFSHIAFAYREGASWTIVHKLNECGTAVSNVFEQGMGQFFLDDPFKFEDAIAVPAPEVQQRILAVLKNPEKVLTEYIPQYSMLAYAWGNKYQQSNQWVLETLALAMEPQIKNREQAQAWLKFKGYEPSTLNIGPMTRLGARMFKANIAFDDHPNDKRFSDRIETVTADSVFDFLKKSGLGVSYFTVSL
ncbi:DUF2145 domain-containing protein [Collimonas sp.]|jgi:hypothetical protein|uniref:DUF2145 domain-containing protein n=1 Tax=Collimonas sp. TaxID=1963772 RepID=UPI002CDE076C|nr:DUF2145 domain-containing protein [Collimonas sp.]HWW05791.1 DUF2145 domain-containing protein [Collimonas sp.]